MVLVEKYGLSLQLHLELTNERVEVVDQAAEKEVIELAETSEEVSP